MVLHYYFLFNDNLFWIFSEVDKTDPSLISPCCQRIYHFDCVQSMALSYGKAHLKCPMCSDKKKFCEEALNQGVYIPGKYTIRVGIWTILHMTLLETNDISIENPDSWF